MMNLEEFDRLRRDARAGWASFYVACACVGLLVATLLWQRYRWQPACEGTPPPHPVAQVYEL